MFTQMLNVAKERLLKHDNEEIAKKANIKYNKDEDTFYIPSLGRTIKVKSPEFSVSSSLNEWYQLVILHYMDLADGYELTDQLISFSQMKEGLVRGGGFDRNFEKVIQYLLHTISEEAFKEKCTALGGRIIQTKADFAVVFPFLPMVQITLNVWFADEDFDASGRLMLDASTEHYLTIEDAVTVGGILIDLLQSSIPIYGGLL